ncbi:MAG: hypothetical protein P8Y70_14605 [Candidatus Lokiarchaeota archaeon]
MAWFWDLKLRLILAGCIVAIIGVILLITHPGLFISYVIIIVGIIVLVIGLIWKFKSKVKPETNNTN